VFDGFCELNATDRDAVLQELITVQVEDGNLFSDLREDGE